MARMLLTILTISGLLALAACAQVNELDETNEEPEAHESALHNAVPRTLTFGETLPLALSRAEPLHTFIFELSDAASVALSTAEDETGASVDTVISLYRERKTGWGPVVARSDDHEGSHFSRITRDLPMGRYRLDVRGFKRATTGGFVLYPLCAGAGCPAQPLRCVFGSTYRELRDGGGFTVESALLVTAANVAYLTVLEQEQLLSAVRVAYEDAADLASALDSVDQNEVNRLVLRELGTGRSFTAYEYGAGDNSYGGVFETPSAELAAQIRDGDLYECRVLRE